MMRVATLVALLLLAGCSGQDKKEHRVRHPQLVQVEEQVRRSVENSLTRWRQNLSIAQLPVERAQAYAQLGQVYLAHHFDEAGADALEYATSQVTTNPHWYFYYAIALERSHRLIEAQAALTAALDLQENQEIRFTRAKVSARLGAIPEALADLQTLKERANASEVESASDRGDSALKREAAWYALEAELFAIEKRYEEAAESLNVARELAPDATALNAPAARLQQLLGEHELAAELMKEAGRQTPDLDQPLMQALSALSRGSQYYLERGRSWMQARNFQQAAIEFAAAADIAPSSHEARLAYARALEIVGRVDEAEQRYLEAIQLDPTSAVTQYFLGMLYERRQQDEKSRYHYAQAITSNPSYLAPRLALAHAHFRDENYEEAFVHYVEYSASRKEDFAPRYYAGLAALALGNCETAPNWFEQAVEANSHNRDAQEGLARSYAVCSDDPDKLNQAQGIGERLEESRPDAAAAATLAMVHAALNDWESALRLQNLAIRRSEEEQINGQRDRLTQYESGQRAKVAWLSGDPVFEPPRLTMRVLQ